MKRRNDYKIRAFELGQEGKVNEAPQQVSTGAKKETPLPRASGPASHRPAWRVEVVEELPKKKRVRRGRPPLPKKTQKTKQKKPSPLGQLVHVFFFAFSLCFHMGFVIFPSSHIGSLHSVSMVSSKAWYSR